MKTMSSSKRLLSEHMHSVGGTSKSMGRSTKFMQRIQELSDRQKVTKWEEMLQEYYSEGMQSFNAMRMLRQRVCRSLNDTQRETISKTLSTVKDELTDLSAKVDNISLDVKDGQAEANVQRKMLESQIAQWVGSDIAFILNSGMTKTYNFRQLTLLQKKYS